MATKPAKASRPLFSSLSPGMALALYAAYCVSAASVVLPLLQVPSVMWRHDVGIVMAVEYSYRVFSSYFLPIGYSIVFSTLAYGLLRENLTRSRNLGWVFLAGAVPAFTALISFLVLSGFVTGREVPAANAVEDFLVLAAVLVPMGITLAWTDPLRIKGSPNNALERPNED